ncbi:molybdopterin synthase sulfur carrier subunit [Algoriphagus sp. AK58]|nr:molybdopterin synthase sulfur carrier subunit [Algoriphagus sp. AK58]
MQIKAFGMIAEAIGSDSLEIENPGTSLALKKQLEAQFPGLKSMKFSLAVDKKMIQEDTDISQGKEIALLPPFSGG